MNRLLLSVLAIATLFIAPITTFAQTSDQELINQLMRRLVDLQEQLRTRTETETTQNAISIRLTSPNGGENFNVGEKMDITWNSKGLPARSKVSISLVRKVVINTPWGDVDGHYGQTSIKLNTPNDGKFTWKIPSWIPEGEEYMIDISGSAGNEEGKGAVDKSDDVFSIGGGETVAIDIDPSEVQAGSSVRVTIGINDQEVADEADSIMISLKNQDERGSRAGSYITYTINSQGQLYSDILIPASARTGTWVVDSVSIFGNNSILARYWYPDEINKTFTVTN